MRGCYNIFQFTLKLVRRLAASTLHSSTGWFSCCEVLMYQPRNLTDSKVVREIPVVFLQKRNRSMSLSVKMSSWYCWQKEMKRIRFPVIFSCMETHFVPMKKKNVYGKLKLGLNHQEKYPHFALKRYVRYVQTQ